MKRNLPLALAVIFLFLTVYGCSTFSISFSEPNEDFKGIIPQEIEGWPAIFRLNLTEGGIQYDYCYSHSDINEKQGSFVSYDIRKLFNNELDDRAFTVYKLMSFDDGECVYSYLGSISYQEEGFLFVNFYTGKAYKGKSFQPKERLINTQIKPDSILINKLYEEAYQRFAVAKEAKENNMKNLLIEAEARLEAIKEQERLEAIRVAEEKRLEEIRAEKERAKLDEIRAAEEAKKFGEEIKQESVRLATYNEYKKREIRIGSKVCSKDNAIGTVLDRIAKKIYISMGQFVLIDDMKHKAALIYDKTGKLNYSFVDADRYAYSMSLGIVSTLDNWYDVDDWAVCPR